MVGAELCVLTYAMKKTTWKSDYGGSVLMCKLGRVVRCRWDGECNLTATGLGNRAIAKMVQNARHSFLDLSFDSGGQSTQDDIIHFFSFTLSRHSFG